jgi:hypothetical protein
LKTVHSRTSAASVHTILMLSLFDFKRCTENRLDFHAVSASAAAVITCGHRGQCVPVWVVALFIIKRLIKEAIETLSSPIAVVQETGQLVKSHCPSQIV